MKISVVSQPLEKLSAGLLVIFAVEDKLLPEEKLVDRFLAGRLAKLRQSKDFSGEVNQTRLIFATNSTPRVLLVGLGKQKALTLEAIREAAAAAGSELKRLPVKHAAFLLPSLPGLSPQTLAQAVMETVLLANYEFPYYKLPGKDRVKLQHLELVTAPKDLASARAGSKTGQILAQAVTAVRDLGNHPSNVATPTHLAEHAQRIAKDNKNLKVKILHRPEIKKENMGALLAVSQGSDEEPKFIILEYRGGGGPRVVLVGKGITFDSGGISLKPGEKMEEMKYDMAGAATVMGVIKAACELRLPLNLVGLIPATENLPSGKASRPGDIVKSRSGKTIEIISTDAEGRLVLSDALDYAKKYKPDLVIDFATLTGAIVVALGDDLIGAFTNQERFVPQLKAAAEATGEPLWPMPLYRGYEEFIKSDFADIRNLGSTTKYGDAINAALFLQNFVDYPWIHLDIAGVAWTTREKPYRPKGATGTGVRLAIEFLKNFRK